MTEWLLAVSFLLASHGPPHGLEVTWPAVPNATFYWVQVGRWPGKDWRIAGTPSAPRYVYTEGLFPPGTCFRAASENPAGRSAYSAQACHR